MAPRKLRHSKPSVIGLSQGPRDASDMSSETPHGRPVSAILSVPPPLAPIQPMLRTLVSIQAFRRCAYLRVLTRIRLPTRAERMLP